MAPPRFDVCRTVTVPQSSTAAFRGALLAIGLGAVCAGQSVSQTDHPRVTREDASTSTLKHNLSLGVCSPSRVLLGDVHQGEPHPTHSISGTLQPSGKQTPGMGDGKQAQSGLTAGCCPRGLSEPVSHHWASATFSSRWVGPLQGDHFCQVFCPSEGMAVYLTSSMYLNHNQDEQS